jgi:glycosyltransferase involved in cell wall biosynthesis
MTPSVNARSGRSPHVLVVSHYYPPHVGGLEVVAREVAAGLQRAGHPVSVLTSACGAQAGEHNEAGVQVRRIPAWNGFEGTIGVPFPLFSPSLIWRAFTMVRRADVVQIHDMLYVSCWVTALFCRLLRTPYVVTQHVGLVAHSMAIVRWVQILVHRTLGRWVLRGADHIIPINTFIEASTQRLVPRARTRVLRNGVNTERYRPAVGSERATLRARYGLPVEGLLFFYVGRFVPKKGFDLLAACVDDAYTLVFVGGDRPEGLPEDRRRIFLGSRAADEVAELYRTADLFVSASVGESPLTVLEAMNSGVGVLLNEDPGLRALGVGGAGVRWLPMDHQSLRTELGALAADRHALTAMGQEAVATAADSFSWDHHVAELQRVFADSCKAVRHRVTRIAVVTPYYPPKVGGVELYAHRQVGALRAHPHYEPLVITTGPTQRTTITDEEGVLVIRLGRGISVSNTPLDPRWTWQLPRILSRYDVDLLSAHAPVPGLADLALRVAGKRPVVMTYHAGSLVKANSSSAAGRGMDTLLTAYERWVLPSGFARAKRLVGVSPASLAMKYDARLITPGVDTTLFTPGESTGGPPTLLYVGRLERASAWKGVDVLLRAFVLVHRAVPPARLQLAGDGDALEDLQELASRLGVAEAVDWLGAMEHPQLVGHYQQATAVVLPSLTEAESFGMTLIEAMACARPVVASRVGGVPFVVRSDVDGVLVAPGHVEALASACLGLLRDPARADSMGRAGRRAVESRFSWPAITDQMIEVFDEVVNEASQTTDRSRWLW